MLNILSEVTRSWLQYLQCSPYPLYWPTRTPCSASSLESTAAHTKGKKPFSRVHACFLTLRATQRNPNPPSFILQHHQSDRQCRRWVVTLWRRSNRVWAMGIIFTDHLTSMATRAWPFKTRLATALSLSTPFIVFSSATPLSTAHSIGTL